MTENPAQKVSFDLGPLLSTPGAMEALERTGTHALDLVRRHARGDWGELCDEDRAANESALSTGARLMSVYRLSDGTVLWVITDAEIDDEHHRQATTLLLPDEY